MTRKNVFYLCRIKTDYRGRVKTDYRGRVKTDCRGRVKTDYRPFLSYYYLYYNLTYIYHV